MIQDPADESADKLSEKVDNLSGNIFHMLSFFINLYMALNLVGNWGSYTFILNLSIYSFLFIEVASKNIQRNYVECQISVFVHRFDDIVT